MQPDTALSHAFREAGYRTPAQRLHDAAVEAITEAPRDFEEATALFLDALREDGDAVFELFAFYKMQVVAQYLRRTANEIRKPVTVAEHRRVAPGYGARRDQRSRDTHHRRVPASASTPERGALDDHTCSDTQSMSVVEDSDPAPAGGAAGPLEVEAQTVPACRAKPSSAIALCARLSLLDRQVETGKRLGDCTKADLTALARCRDRRRLLRRSRRGRPGASRRGDRKMNTVRHRRFATQCSCADVGDVGQTPDAARRWGADISQTIAAMRQFQVWRVWSIKQQMRNTLALKALVRRHLGWRPDLSEAERKSVCTAADKFITEARKGTRHDEIAHLIELSDIAAEPINRQRAEWERQMEKLAKTLPVWPWVESVRGFGARGLAIIVGEAGDLLNYPNPAKLWKRMGLGLVGDRRQGNPEHGTAEEWIAHGYNKLRRSQIWTLGDSLLKGNGEGPYRALYLERKEYELSRAPEMTKMHAHRRAQRYVEKRLLRDLWRAWREAAEDLPPIGLVPPSNLSPKDRP